MAGEGTTGAGRPMIADVSTIDRRGEKLRCPVCHGFVRALYVAGAGRLRCGGCRRRAEAEAYRERCLLNGSSTEGR